MLQASGGLGGSRFSQSHPYSQSQFGLPPHTTFPRLSHPPKQFSSHVSSAHLANGNSNTGGRSPFCFRRVARWQARSHASAASRGARRPWNRAASAATSTGLVRGCFVMVRWWPGCLGSQRPQAVASAALTLAGTESRSRPCGPTCASGGCVMRQAQTQAVMRPRASAQHCSWLHGPRP